jgi:hypothetical protein
MGLLKVDEFPILPYDFESLPSTLNQVLPAYAADINEMIDNFLVSMSAQRATFAQAVIETLVVTTYGATITIDASLGNWFSVTITDNSAHAFAAPTNPSLGQRIMLTVRNVGAGTPATATFNAVFKGSATGGYLYVVPANGFSTSCEFGYDGVNWIQLGIWVQGVPN